MKELVIQSHDNKPIQLYIWDNVARPVGVVQLVHGSCEHTRRYDRFATNLNDAGWIVVGNDHRGHGKTAQLQNNKLGYFQGNWHTLVRDLKKINEYISKTYNLPISMFGHSMGSFLALSYNICYDSTIEQTILCGFTWYSKIMLRFAIQFIKKECAIYGKEYINQKIYNMSYKTLNNKFKNEGNTGSEWLSANLENRNRFLQDSECGFVFSNNYFLQMFEGIYFNEKNIKSINKDKNILIISGKDDPVGNFGHNISRGYNVIKKYNPNVSFKLYEGCRHEILFDNKKHEVLNDIIDFLVK